MADAGATPFQSGAAVAIFLASCAGVVALALRPQRLPLLPEAWWRALCRRSRHHPCPRPHLPVIYACPPVLGTLLMLACTSLSPRGLWRGVAGDAQIQPYAIVVVFLGLAYLAASLDATGALACAALSCARRAKGSGRALYFAFFALSSLLTLGTSNDVCVMALCPLILHACSAARADPSPFLYASFAASNLASIALMFGNPTNLIVAVAAKMTFLSYARAMALPAAAAVLSALGCMYYAQGHRRRIPERLVVMVVVADAGADGAAEGTGTGTGAGSGADGAAEGAGADAETRTGAAEGAAADAEAGRTTTARRTRGSSSPPLLSDPWGAAWSAACLAACLALLAAAPSVGWPLWPPVLGCCALQLAFSVVVYGLLGKGGGWGDFFEARAAAPEDALVAAAAHPHHHGGLEAAAVEEGRAAAAVELSSSLAAAPGAAAAKEATATTTTQTMLNPSRPSASSLPLLLLQPPPPAAERRRIADSSGGPDPEAAAAARAPAPRLRRRSREQAHPPLPPPSPPVDAAPDEGLPPPSLLIETLPVPTVLGPLASLPLHTVPFVLGMFCLVEGLAETGVADALGRALGRATAGGNPYLAALVVGVAATFACNAINNQPMTVLFTRALLSPGGFAAGVVGGGGSSGAAVAAAGGDAALRAALFATVVASNVGANFTLVGALAGVMFADIVKRKEREGGGGGGGAAAAAGGLLRRGKGAAAARAGAEEAAAGAPPPLAPAVDVSYWGFFRMLAPGGAASLVAALGVLMAQIAVTKGGL